MSLPCLCCRHGVKEEPQHSDKNTKEEIEVLKKQNERLQYQIQQLKSENADLKRMVEKLSKKINEMQIIIKE
jgi:predicted RNase H-like nuclease (RuvC/YqgF family)